MRTEDSSGGQNLHPSWAAKKKAQHQDATFQGKRTRLDEEGGGGKAKAKVDPKMHPSWAARSEQNKIADFKGKKTLFE